MVWLAEVVLPAGVVPVKSTVTVWLPDLAVVVRVYVPEVPAVRLVGPVTEPSGEVAVILETVPVPGLVTLTVTVVDDPDATLAPGADPAGLPSTSGAEGTSDPVLDGGVVEDPMV